MTVKSVCVVGLGYIGLPTAAIASLSGYQVLGLDVNKDIVDSLNCGKIHIVEPGLQEVVQQSVSNGSLKAISVAEPADVFVIAVPTPFKGLEHTPDLSFIQSVASMISPVLNKGNLVILESTSPVGTTENLRGWLSKNRPDLNFSVDKDSEPDVFIAYCPERVLPGNTLKELRENDRVIGGLCEKSSDLAVSFYSQFVTGKCYRTNAKTAEMSKLVENSYRDVNIAFANELATLSKELDINVWELINLANRHPRVNILYPGAGVGGHCIAVDPWFIISQNPEKSALMKQARLINDHKPQTIIHEVMNLFLTKKGDLLDNKNKIGLFGLSYKQDIDDLRESPAVIIAKKLVEEFPDQVYVVEPHITNKHEVLNSGLHLVSQEKAFLICNLIVFLVPHSQFKEALQTVSLDAQVLDYCGLTEGLR